MAVNGHFLKLKIFASSFDQTFFFVSGFDSRDFYGFVAGVVAFVTSILLEGFSPPSTSMLDMVLFMSSGLEFVPIPSRSHWTSNLLDDKDDCPIFLISSSNHFVLELTGVT